MSRSIGRKHRRRPRARSSISAKWAVDPFAVILAVFLLILLLFGGSSRYDQLAQVPVRVASLLVIAVASFRLVRDSPRALRMPALLLGASVALVCAQLVPLPPSLWPHLPGRAALADAAAQFAQPWRPIAIVPDLAVNALLALTVPVATLYGLATMDPRLRRWIMPALLLITAASLLAGIIQMVTDGSGFTAIYTLNWQGTAPGIFANRNHQALLLSMGLVLMAGWEQLRLPTRSGRAARWSGAIVGALLVVTLVATGSRAGLLLGGLGLCGGWAVLWSWLRRQVPGSRWLLTLPLTLAGLTAVLVIISVWFGRGQALDRWMTVDPLGDKRARAFPTVIELVRTYFPVGSGYGSFDAAFRRAEPFNLLEVTYFNQAHNDLVQVVLEGGIAGLLLLFVALGWLGHATLRVWRSSSPSGAVVRARSASFALILAVVASAIDYPLRTPIMMAIASALTFLLAIGLAEIDGSERRLPAVP